MDETIELREIINTLLKGKWIIVICTFVALLITAIYSWTVKTETFTSTATVQIAKITQNIEDTKAITNYISAEFTPTVYMQRFNQNGLQFGNVTAMNEPNTELILLSSVAATAENAEQQLQQAIDTTTKDFETSVVELLTETNEEYLKETEQLSTEIEYLLKRYNKIVQDNNLPGILLFQTLLTENFTLELTTEQLSPINTINGLVQNELLNLKSEIDVKTEEYRTLLANYQATQSSINGFQIEQYVRTIVEPTEAVSTTTPNMKMNLVIGLVLGLMIGIGLVFFRSYWRATAK